MGFTRSGSRAETSATATRGRSTETADTSTVGRTRSRSRTETADASAVGRKEAVAFHDIDFAHLWRQMAAAGWTYKRPRGIETEWKYMNPSGSAVLVGESAVMEYAIKSGLLGDNEDDEGNDSNEDKDGNNDDDSKECNGGDESKDGNDDGEDGEGGMSNDRDEEIRVSQIDTTAQLSQKTLNDLFGSSSDSDVELSQAAVARAFDLSPTELEQHHDAAQSLQLLSEASGMESDSQLNPLPTTTPDRDRRSRSKIKPDVNYIPETENMNDYESYSSGESDDNVDEDNADSDDLHRGYVDEQDDVLSEDDAVEMDQAFVDSLLLGADTVNPQAAQQREDALRATEWGPLSSGFETDAQPYPGLNIEDARPVSALRGVAHSPILTLFYFMPKSLWITIGIETNRYGLQQVPRRAEVMRQKQPEGRRETLKQIRRRLKSKRGYETHEILHVVGLLVARMLCPQQRRFAAHWSMVEDGAVPAGNFGRYMSRNRCQDILRDLHFVDNEADRPRDKLWKLRPIIDKLQRQFLNGWTLPSVFSFDEGVLPATSKRSPTRMFMPDKPHRYGSKLFMTCDSKSAYCHRFEMYAGKRRDTEAESAFDHKTGAAAVVRNLKTVFGSSARQPWHVVVVDRYYSSILLAIELLSMHVYVIGTIMTNRLGYDQRVKEKRQTRPRRIPRGTFTYSRSVAIPSMVCFHWWDRKPVHYLCTGVTMSESKIDRNIKQVGRVTIPCPDAVSDYQRWMGGVDVHDQLRLQQYSLQTSTKFKKYYKSLFLGLLDLALVNAYITHKESARLSGTVAMKRGEWYCVLQNQLLQVKAEDFLGVVMTPPPSQKRKRTPLRVTHALEQCDDWVTVSGTQKRRQRSCKVCALLRTDTKKKSYATTFFCERCSIDDAKCWLCNKIRRHYKGVEKTCFEIWHDDFNSGQSIPANLGKRVVLRRPGQRAGKRKKTRRELRLRCGGGDADDEKENESDHC